MSEVLQNRLILINTLQATGDAAGARWMRSPALYDTQGVELHAQPLGLPEEIDQHKGAPLAVVLKVLPLKTPQRPAGDLNCVTWSKHALKESLRGLPEQVIVGSWGSTLASPTMPCMTWRAKAASASWLTVGG